MPCPDSPEMNRIRNLVKKFPGPLRNRNCYRVVAQPRRSAFQAGLQVLQSRTGNLAGNPLWWSMGAQPLGRCCHGCPFHRARAGWRDRLAITPSLAFNKFTANET